VLTVFALEVPIVPETSRLNPRWKRLAKIIAITTKPRIKNCNLDSLATVAAKLPTIHAEESQMAGLISVNRSK
jgi:hypothetical protein